jgi:hypothetical protein
MKKKRISYFIVFIALMMGACNTAPAQGPLINIGDGGFLSEKPCGPPCFMGIIPGESSETDVINILKDLNIYSQCELYTDQSDKNHNSYACQDFAIVNIGRSSNLVTSLGYQPDDTIRVKEAITKFGPPNHIMVVNASPSGLAEVRIILYYDTPPMRISLPDQSGFSYNLSPDITIENIAYLAKSDYDQLIQSLSKSFLTWKGYSEYPLIIHK